MSQPFVDRVFRECLARDLRRLEEIQREVRVQHATAWRGIVAADGASGLREMGLPSRDWAPTDYQLQVAVSRTASRTDDGGDRPYFPAYTSPPRFLSVTRLRVLLGRSSDGTAKDTEREELRRQLADLDNVRRHWREQERRARLQLEALHSISVEAARASEIVLL